MSVPASLEHVPAIPNQLPVEPLLAPNPLELDNDYLDAVDYDDEMEPYEDLDDEEEDPENNPEMYVDEEEEDPKMDVDDGEEEEPLPASPPPLSPLRTPPPVSKSSPDFDIPVTTTTTVGRPYKGPLSTYEEMSFVIERDIPKLMNDSTATRDRLTLLEQDNVKNREEIQKLKNQVQSANISATLAAMDMDRIEKTQDQNVQMQVIQQEMYWRGFKENCPTESIDVLATYGDADPPELQEPSDTQ
ncbi:hypothetical protein Tco_0320607 [Tanacetum coccineum]